MPFRLDLFSGLTIPEFGIPIRDNSEFAFVCLELPGLVWSLESPSRIWDMGALISAI